MLTSYNWLQSHFQKPLPSVTELSHLLTMHAFEIEDTKKWDDDVVIDVDVLPNRSSDCLSHWGIVREIETLAGVEATLPKSLTQTLEAGTPQTISVEREETDQCRRYIARVVKNVNIAPSPEWIQDMLLKVGQKPINNIVDATNFVMFELGQPLHAFDADKIDGDTIFIRYAKKGESITTLDGQVVELDTETLVIADEKDPLAIAGIKGGKKAEVNEKTKNIILESAHFDPVSVRKTSTRLKIRTESSKRFENNVPVSFASDGMGALSSLIKEVASSGGETQFEAPVEDAEEEKSPQQIAITSKAINDLLGSIISDEEVEVILKKLHFKVRVVVKGEQIDEGVIGREILKDGTSAFIVTVPLYRTDVNRLEDIVEEVGRVYGYENIEARALPEESFIPRIDRNVYYMALVKNELRALGFYEVIGHIFAPDGDRRVQSAASEERPYIRRDLRTGMKSALESNRHYAPLLGRDVIRVFEIGKVFKENKEEMHFALGVLDTSSKKQKRADQAFEEIREALKKSCGIKLEALPKEGILEISYDELIKDLPEPKSFGSIFTEKIDHISYEPLSSYPFMLRDIAVFVPEETDEQEIMRVIREHSGDLLAKTLLFDVFPKEFEDGTKKVSYAYHLVFQSYERTLSDGEVGEVMKNIEEDLRKKSCFDVR